MKLEKKKMRAMHSWMPFHVVLMLICSDAILRVVSLLLREVDESPLML